MENVREMRHAGSVTVMTVIMLLPVAVFAVYLITVSAAAVRTETAASKLQYAVMSAAASYDVNLLSGYGLFAVNANKVGREEFTGHFASEEGASIIFKKCIGEKTVLRRQICADMKYKAAVMAAESFIEKLKQLGLEEKTDAVREKEDSEDSTFSISLELGVEELVDTAKTLLSTAVGINVPDIGAKEIWNGLKTYFAAVFGEGSVPNKRWLIPYKGSGDNADERGNAGGGTDKDDSNEAKTAKAEYGASFLDKITAGLRATGDKISICTYVLDKFSYYGHETEREAFYDISEAEYVIFGNKTGAKNIEKSFDRIMLIRMAINFADNIVSLKIPEAATLVATASAAALIQSYADLLLLMGGEAAPLIQSNDKLTASYSDYLLLMLLMSDEETILERIRDVVNINLCEASDGEESIAEFYTSMTGSVGINAQFPGHGLNYASFCYQYGE